MWGEPAWEWNQQWGKQEETEVEFEKKEGREEINDIIWTPKRSFTYNDT